MSTTESAADTTTEDLTAQVTVCIPWRPTSERVPLMLRVKRFWEEAGFHVVFGDSAYERFNLSAARNTAVQHADTDVVIIADADTIPTIRAIRAAVEIATEIPMVVYPFDRYQYITIEDPDDLEHYQDATVEREYVNSTGGLIVVQRALYWQLGGMDPGFMQWGYEDNAFEAAAVTLASVHRVPGIAYAFAHDAERIMGEENPGRARMRLYTFARRQGPEVMRELVRR